jgi:hypothetical protein
MIVDCLFLVATLILESIIWYNTPQQYSTTILHNYPFEMGSVTTNHLFFICGSKSLSTKEQLIPALKKHPLKVNLNKNLFLVFTVTYL